MNSIRPTSKCHFIKTALKGQVFSVLNYSFIHLEFHRNASVHYRNDKLNNGTYRVILSVHCVLRAI